MIEQVIISTTADTTQAEGAYEGLRSEIKTLKNELDKLEEGTVEYNATFTKLSAKMFEQRERMQALKNSAGDLGQMLGNVSGLAGTVAQGFAGATAALSLFGIENEALLRTVQKVQAFESIARTLASFEDAPKKIKALFANIQGIFNANKGLKTDIQIDVNKDVSRTITPNVEGFEASANAAKAIETSATVTSGAAVTNLASQGAITSELKSQVGIEVTKARLKEAQAESDILALNREKQMLDLKIQELALEKESILFENEQLNMVSEVNANRSDAIDNEIRQSNARIGSIDTQSEEIIRGLENVDNEISNTTKKTKTFGSSIKSFFSNISGALVGLGIGAVIGAAIFAVTKLVDYFKTRSEEINKKYADALKTNADLAKSQEAAAGKELSTLKVLTTGYKNLSKDKAKQQQFLEKNKDSYEEIGVEINKVIKGEISYSKAIEDTNKVLIERAKTMGAVNLLMTKYSEQFQLQTELALNAESINKFIPINFAFVRGQIPDINRQVTSLIAEGFGSEESIISRIITANQNAVLSPEALNQLKAGITTLLSSLPDDFQEKTKATGDSLVYTNKVIAELEKTVGDFDLTNKKAGDGVSGNTVVIKTYYDLLMDLGGLYKQLNLNNPFTPERFDAIAKELQTIQDNISLSIRDTLLSGNDTYLMDLKDLQLKSLSAEIIFQEKSRKLKEGEALWTLNKLNRDLTEQNKVRKDNYSAIFKDAQDSFNAGKITIEQFNSIATSIGKDMGVTINSFKELDDFFKTSKLTERDNDFIKLVVSLEEKLKSGELSLEEFKKTLNDTFKINVDVLDPSKDIDFGTIGRDNFNYLQELLTNYDTYYSTLNNLELEANANTKTNTTEFFNIQLAIIDMYSKKIADAVTKANLLLQISKSSIEARGLFNISGYNDVMLEINSMLNEINGLNSEEQLINNRIALYNEELNSATITAERRIELNNLIKDSEIALLQVQSDIATKEESILKKRLDLRASQAQSIIDTTLDVTTSIQDIYDSAERTELADLKALYDAKLISQEEYNEQSEGIAYEYAKKRQELEIFTGVMSAISSSIGAFQSAMTSGIPAPYNYILAGVSSAAAFASVMASVSKLKSLTRGDTSVSPTSSGTGSSLNYSLNQQNATNERMLNSLTDTRVYVLESDITGTQATIQEIESMSTF